MTTSASWTSVGLGLGIGGRRIGRSTKLACQSEMPDAHLKLCLAAILQDGRRRKNVASPSASVLFVGSTADDPNIPDRPSPRLS